MKRTYSSLLVVATLVPLLFAPSQASAQETPLGTAASFGVLAGSMVISTGSTVIGNVGVSPGTTVVGFPPGSVTGGTIHSNDAVAQQAQIDVTSVYNVLAGLPCNTVLTGQDLGGLTLVAGVYCFSSSVGLTGTLTLDAQGDPNAQFIFQMASFLTTASNSVVRVINGGQNCNVYWQVGSSATIGTATAFTGNILALVGITVMTGANVSGRLLARTGAVTLDTNSVALCPACNPITLSPSTLPAGTIGAAYNQTISASGGTAPYTFTVVSGSLPPGLTLSAAGTLSGTPTTAGSSTFTIRATDAAGCLGERIYTALVNCPVITIAPATLPTGAVGGAYNQTISATGGTAPYAFSVTTGAGPNGLSLNATTGAITGAPNLAGTFTFTITATDTNGCSGSQAFTLTITIAFGQISLGTAQSFAVLGGSGVTNTGASSIRGDVGVSPGIIAGTFVTGFPPGVVTGGTIHAGDAAAAQAQTDLTTAYNAVEGMPCNVSLGGQDIGGRTLTPGVYCFPGPTLTGTLILDFQGDPNAVFVFQTVSVFMTAANSSVLTINAGGSTCPPNVFWQVGFGPSLGANSVFVGNILGNGISLGTGARLSGRALARNGSVTLDTNTVGMCPTVIIKGDANGDGATTVGDIFYLINSLFTGGPASIGAADVNGDGQVTVGDIFYLINYLFAGGPAPV